MGVVEAFLLFSLGNGIGYVYRWWTEPEVICRTIEYNVPEHLKTPLNPIICKRGVDPNTGIKKECYVNEDPVYEMTKENRLKFHLDISDLQGNLFECEQLTKEQKENPKIIK